MVVERLGLHPLMVHTQCHHVIRLSDKHGIGLDLGKGVEHGDILKVRCLNMEIYTSLHRYTNVHSHANGGHWSWLQSKSKHQSSLPCLECVHATFKIIPFPVSTLHLYFG